MSLQIYFMRKGAGKNKEVYTTTNEETGKFGAIEYVSHPTPSGADRWLPTLEVNPLFDTEEEAKTKLQEAFDQIDEHFKDF